MSFILALALLGGLAMLGYSIASPIKEPFTEFYLLGLSGQAKDYPGRLSLGEEGKVVVGIVNREYETVGYRLEMRIEEGTSKEVEPVTLEHGGKWQEIVTFTPEKAGDGQKAEFLLYKQGQSEPYRELHLWLDVE